MRSEKQKVRRKNRSSAAKDETVRRAADDAENQASETVDVAAVSNKKKRKLTVQETCDLIAELSEAILEDPEQAFASTTEEDSENAKQKKRRAAAAPSKMQQLLTMANAPTTTTDDQDDQDDQLLYTAQLAIMSLLAIFKDILPAYRIRVPTAQEMAVKVSRETKRTWAHERKLLHFYQQYLQLLERTWVDKQQQQQQAAAAASSKSQISCTAILSLAELLKSAFHFNFRSNLIAAVVRQMNNTNAPPAVRNACCESIEFVFAHDAQGEVALEAARQVCKLVKDRAFKVQPRVLATFTKLPLRVHVDEAQAAKLASAANAKKRKRDKESAEIEAELREGKATVDKILLARCQSDTLQAVTLTYFRILKSDLKASQIQTLLPPALEGLAKFAHLINIDTVMDLLGVLRDLLQQRSGSGVDKQLLPVDAALNCIMCALQTLQGPGKEMKIDQKEYIQPLYSQLPRLCSAENSRRTTTSTLVIQCLTLAFIKRKEYSTVRVAAFFKQILTTALHAEPAAAISLVAFARQLALRYPTVLEQMLENESDVVTVGQYTPDVQDPEHANPSATSAWELAALKFHVHPGVAAQANCAAASKMLQFPGEDPARLLTNQLRNADELYIPFARIRKKHPLQANGSSGKSDSKKQRNQIRFVKPRSYQQKFVEDVQAVYKIK